MGNGVSTWNAHQNVMHIKLVWANSLEEVSGFKSIQLKLVLQVEKHVHVFHLWKQLLPVFEMEQQIHEWQVTASVSSFTQNVLAKSCSFPILTVGMTDGLGWVTIGPVCM